MLRYDAMVSVNAAEPVYMKLVDFVAHGSTVERVANFRPSAESLKGLAELLDRQRDRMLQLNMADRVVMRTLLQQLRNYPRR